MTTVSVAMPILLEPNKERIQVDCPFQLGTEHIQCFVIIKRKRSWGSFKSHPLMCTCSTCRHLVNIDDIVWEMLKVSPYGGVAEVVSECEEQWGNTAIQVLTGAAFESSLDIDLAVEYEARGKYYRATYEEPEEYPEIEVKSALFCGVQQDDCTSRKFKQLITELDLWEYFDSSIQDRVIELCWEDHKENDRE